MKKMYSIPIEVEAYSQADAQAKVDLMIQITGFGKDFNVKNLAGSIIQSVVFSAIGEVAERITETDKAKSAPKSTLNSGAKTKA
jgi:hypothetical protein